MRHTSGAKQKSKLASLQALRGIAALLVVLLHTAVTLGKYGANGDSFFGDFSIGHAGIDLFFVISGFIMMVTAAPRAGSSQEAFVFLKRRAWRIYPTYWLYFSLVYLVFLLRPEWVNASAATQADLLSSFFLIPAEGMPLVMVAWTLEFEIFFYVLFAGTMLLPRSYVLPALLGILGALVSAGALMDADSEMAKVFLSPLLLEFGLGSVIGALHAGPIRSGGKWVAVVGALMLLSVAVGFDWTEVMGLADSDFARPLTYGLASALLVYGFTSWEKQGAFRCPPILLKIGDASYTLYLSHILVLSAVGRSWALMNLGPWSDGLFALVLLISTVAYALVAYRYLEKPMMRIWNPLQRRRLSLTG
jgi:peptidoglycan/LPS O-acetylase OafA/YrhL